ncbi:MAG TPA: tetratricopeptide repeat protein [Candidatus Marinimicrobia bacterium]|nr:tetratricopeptide repeat protein [Candidatus Neomarinimicrobiota bacterium]
MMRILKLLPLFFIMQNLLADPGLRAWENEKYNEARAYYQNRLEKENKPLLYYNMGTSAHKEGNANLAEEALTQALKANDPKLLAKTHYNLGQVQIQQKNLQGAAENFLKSILYDPSDSNAKAMYELTRQMMQQQEQQEQPGGDHSQEEDQQDQEQKQSDGQDENQQENSSQKISDDNQQEEQQEQSSMSVSPQEQQMSDDQAENILNAMREREKEAMKKLLNQQYKGSKLKRSKEW